MKYLFRPIFALAIVALLSATSIQANNQEKMIIALKTDGNELVHADISELAIGEAKTIETDDGTVIDILRTADGAELYVDGELLEMEYDAEGMHADHMIKRHVVIICEDDENCNETEIIFADNDSDMLTWVSEDGASVFINKEIEFSCTDDDEGTGCADQLVWVTEGDDIDIERIHELHQGEDGHKIMVIRKKIITEN